MASCRTSSPRCGASPIHAPDVPGTLYEHSGTPPARGRTHLEIMPHLNGEPISSESETVWQDHNTGSDC